MVVEVVGKGFNYMHVSAEGYTQYRTAKWDNLVISDICIFIKFVDVLQYQTLKSVK